MKLIELSNKELYSLLFHINKEPLLYRNKLNINNNILFGNEIEVDNLSDEKADMIVDILNSRYLYDSYNSFYTNDEGTCDAEIATPPLSNTEYNWKMFAKAYEMISSNGARITENTSSHVHISSDLIDSNNKLITFLKLAFTFEDIIFKFGYGYQNNPRKYLLADKRIVYAALLSSEEISSYLNVLTNCDYSSPYFKSSLINLKTAKRLNYINFKYFDIEKFIKDSSKEDHIEFRNFNGTLYPEIAQNNINLTANIIESISNNRIDLELLDKLYIEELNKKKKYDNVIKNTIVYLYKDSRKEYNELLNSYSIPNINKAILFADMIYEKEIDKLYFLKQYLKLFNKKEEDIKKITMI